MDNEDYEVIDNLTLRSKLAETKNCEVFRAVKEESVRTQVVVKKTDTTKMKKEVLELIKAEAKLLTDLHHENIVKCHKEILMDNKLYIVLEYCLLGDVFQFVKNFKLYFKRNPTLRIIQKIMKSVCSAVVYLHEKFIIHRDLKLKNLLLTLNPKFLNESCCRNGNFDDTNFPFNSEYLFQRPENSNPSAVEEFFINNVEVKLTDLGFSKGLKEGEVTKSKIINSYSAPEMNDPEGYTYPSDYWSLGSMTYTLMTGKLLSIGKQNSEDKIVLEKGSCNEMVDFISCLIQKDPNHRLTKKTVLLHPFLSRDASTFTYSESEVHLNVRRKLNFFEGFEKFDSVDDHVNEVEFDERENEIEFVETAHGVELDEPINTEEREFDIIDDYLDIEYNKQIQVIQRNK